MRNARAPWPADAPSAGRRDRVQVPPGPHKRVGDVWPPGEQAELGVGEQSLQLGRFGDFGKLAEGERQVVATESPLHSSVLT